MQGLATKKALDTYHLILAPTHACNLRCRHCYLPDHAAQLLPEAVALRLVEEWSEVSLDERGAFGGIFHVKGGEPFVVPYLKKIMERLVELQSLRLMLTTNGTYTSAKVLESLRKCNDGLHGHVTVIVSLDGAFSATHDALRGAGQFEITVGFLRSLRAMNVQAHLNCVLHAGNVKEVPAYIGLAKDLGVDQINFLPLVPKGFGIELQSMQVPHLVLHRELQAVYETGDQATKKLLAGSLSHILDREETEHVTPAHECVAAYRGLFYITPEGNVYTCPNLVNTEHKIGTVYGASLRELCDSLPTLYANLRPQAGFDDRLICTGERVLYEKTGQTLSLQNLRSLQAKAGSPPTLKSESRKAVAFCVSRNF